MMKPAVTVAIPFYNAEKYLSQAIESVLSQSCPDFILLLLDDGSTDKSLEIAKIFEKDPRVQVISDGKNLNLAFRLNQIPEIAQTEFLARMDADDIMHPKRLEIQLQFLRTHPDVDVLGTNMYSMDEEDFITGIRLPVLKQGAENVRSFWHPTVMAKTAWFRTHKYDEKAVRVEDAELWLRTELQNKFVRLSQPLLFYREFGTDYYKKYLAGLPGVWYILKKGKFSKRHVVFAAKYVMMTLLYTVFTRLGKEHILVDKRNLVKLEKINYKEFLNDASKNP